MNNEHLTYDELKSLAEEKNKKDVIHLHEKSDNIAVDEFIGTWYVIDTAFIENTKYFLLEHEEYGDETASIIVDSTGKLVLDDVYNGFDDLTYHLEAENYLKNAEMSSEGNYNMIDGVINNEYPKVSGYTILDTIAVGNAEFAVGVHETAPSPYVTWQRNIKNDGDGKPNWFWGHYLDDKASAYKDFEKRVTEEVEIADLPIKERLAVFKELSNKLKSDISKNREVER